MQKSAQATQKTAALAKQAFVKAAKTAEVAVKSAAKAVAAAVKALVAAAKALVAAIAAGGWAALVVVLIIGLIATIIASPVGIFFSGDSGGITVSEAIAQTRTAYRAQIEQIRAENPVDKVILDYEGEDIITNWRDIVAIFAVATTTDIENGMDVVTLDDARVARFMDIAFEMNPITWAIAEVSEEIEVDNGDGTTTLQTQAGSVLTITIRSLSYDEMSMLFGFDERQMEALELMLSAEFRPMMNALLGSASGGTALTTEQLEQLFNDLPTGTLGGEIVRLALSRLGHPYSQAKAGQGDYTDCSYLTRWCYEQVDISLPRTAAEQARFCVTNGLTISPDALTPGDLVFFSHDSNGRFMDITHVAIYAGNGMVVDASSSRGEVVYRPIFGGQVLYARPHGGV